MNQSKLKKDFESARAITKPLWSLYMDDPIVRQLLPGFAVVLQKRVAMVSDAFQNADFREIARLAHIIRGSAGSYGYAQVADVAGRIEVEANSTKDGSLLAHDVLILEEYTKAILLSLEDISL